MRIWNKRITFILTVLLLSSCLNVFIPIGTASTVNPTYAGTKEDNNPPSIIFKVSDNSTIYTDSSNLFLEFAVYLSSYNFMNLGSSLYSVSYTSSWQNTPSTVYSWSYHDPSTLSDDDKNPQQTFTGKVDLRGVPVGSYQITITATGGIYATDLGTYTILASTASSTLHFTITNRPPTTQQPTTSPQPGILWATNIPWNLANTPANDLWNTEITGKTRSWKTPIVVDGVLYAGASSNVHGAPNGKFQGPEREWITIYAFNASNGHQIWSYQATFEGVTAISVSEGKVIFGALNDWYLGSASPRMCALDAANGKVLWTVSCELWDTHPVVSDGRVYVNSGQHTVLAIDVASGKIIWKYTATGDISLFDLTVTNNTLFMSSSNDHPLYAIDTENGNLLWNLTTPKGFSSITAANNIVYAPSNDGNIYALNSSTGTELWHKNTESPNLDWVNYITHSNPIYHEGVLYLTSTSVQNIPNAYTPHYSSSILALDGQNGNKIWNHTFNSDIFDSLSFADGIIYTEKDHSVLGFNMQNGALVRNYTNPDLWTQTQPVPANNVIYVGFTDNSNGQIYALIPPEVNQTTEQTATTTADNVSIIIIGAIVAAAIGVLVVVLYTRSKKLKHLP